jgi:hypothetical protein
MQRNIRFPLSMLFLVLPINKIFKKDKGDFYALAYNLKTNYKVSLLKNSLSQFIFNYSLAISVPSNVSRVPIPYSHFAIRENIRGTAAFFVSGNY